MYDLLIESGRIENRKRPIINNEIEAAIKIKQKLGLSTSQEFT